MAEPRPVAPPRLARLRRWIADGCHVLLSVSLWAGGILLASLGLVLALILLATGVAKATVLARAVEGPITAMVSASALQLHPSCKVIVDEDAASALSQREYYDWVFQNEPEWQDYRT